VNVLVIYDGQGNITSVAVPAGHAQGQVRLKPQPGQLVTELDVPDVKDQQQHDEAAYEHLRAIAQDYRIETGPGQPKLARK